MTGMTRGRLPARVYWVRRLMVLGVAVLLVVGIARLLGGFGGGPSAPVRATNVADTPSPTTGASNPATHHQGRPQHPATSRATPLAVPSGPCSAGDISITPSVPHPVAGRTIALVLDISTVSTPACTWKVSGRTLALKITSGPDLIWTTVQCARTIPRESLVLRNTKPKRVTISWNAQRSEPGCPRQTQWALPGTYHLQVAALAGQPHEATFALVAPTPAQVTRTAHPHQHAKHRAGHGH